ncbi:unnamed protein product [Anisakis simplex]|uniref:WD repeat and HMG-box DNA-binding protein 1 (inferred by orthology to a human protein) n=1 Tax=Anisakis simplex TaxID=6269 RepID=A0A0M3K5X9_ANISI|nr:unnamed protein product [Anisakis simplex]
MTSGEFSEPRFLHSPGIIDLCLNKAEDSSGPMAFISSGVDGDVWLWNAEALDDAEYEPKSAQGRTHHSIAWHGDSIYVGHTLTDPRTNVEKSVVSRFSLDDFVVSLPLASFSLDTTTIDVSSDGAILIAGAVDHIVKVIQLETRNYARLECDGQIMCVRIDPRVELFAVSASDGTLRMYPVAAESGQQPLRSIRISSRIPDIESVFALNSMWTFSGLKYFFLKLMCYLRPSQSRLQICWSPSGEYLFAVVQGGVKRFKRDTFEEDTLMLIAISAAQDVFSTCCISSCGTFVAASSMNGTICVWNSESGQLLSSSRYVRNGESKIITSMVWHPTLSETLFFADSEEHICSLSKCTKEVKSESESESRQEKTSSKRRAIVESDDEDTRLSADLGAIKRAYGFDDEGVHVSEKSPEPVGSSVPIEQRPFMPVRALEPFPAYKPPKIPNSFVTSSSPTHLSQRYLKWNQYGTVTSYSTAEENTIEVRWHDVSIHSDIIMDNSVYRYTIADISVELVAFASQFENDSPSELRVQCVNAWDTGSREWSTQMPTKESIQNMSIAEQFLAVATSKRHIRIFSHAGTQLLVISHPGPVLTMCSARSYLTTVSLNGGYFFEEMNDEDTDGNEDDISKPQFNMNINRYEIRAGHWFRSESVVKTAPIALSPNAALEWIGYTRNGLLCTMDSTYCVRLLSENGIWLPIYDFSTEIKSKSDCIFMIGIVEHPTQEIRYVYCKGTHYPPVVSKLLPSIAQWNIPLCNQESEKSQLEEKLIRSELLRCAFEYCGSSSNVNTQEFNGEYAREVIRLFALACKSDRECRAAEFANYAYGTANIIQTLCNFAAKTRHPLLVEKVAEIGRKNANSTDTKRRSLAIEHRRYIEELDDRNRSHFEDGGRDEGTVLAPKLIPKYINWEGSFQRLIGKRKLANVRGLVNDSEHNQEDNNEDASVERQENEDSVETNMDVTSDQHDISSVSSIQSTESSINPYFATSKTSHNPFKKRVTSVSMNESQENLFDALSTPSPGASVFSKSSKSVFQTTPLNDSNKAKKMRKQMASSSKQSLLNFTTPKEDSSAATKTDTAKTGFQLWFESVESELKSQNDGITDEDEIVHLATRQFKQLDAEEKKVSDVIDY